MKKRAKREIEIISGVSEALDFRSENPSASEEEIMEHMMDYIEKRNEELQMKIISGVSYALKLLEKNPDYSDNEVLKIVMKNISKIVEN